LARVGLKGQVDLQVKARFQPALDVRAAIQSFLLPGIRGLDIWSVVHYRAGKLHVHLTTSGRPPMRVNLEAGTRRPVKIQVSVAGYDARLVRAFMKQPWIRRLEGPGTITAQARVGAGELDWNMSGRNFSLEDTPWLIPAWTAMGSQSGVAVDVHASTMNGAGAEVIWRSAGPAQDRTLAVQGSSVTIREILQVFKLQSDHGVAPQRFYPYGYESWKLNKVSMQSQLYLNSMEVSEGHADFESGMQLDLTGSFDIGVSSPQARIEGSLEGVPVAATIESFFAPPAP
jgi:hypothetical protein